MGRAAELLDSVRLVLEGVIRDREEVNRVATSVAATSREVHAVLTRCVEMTRRGQRVEAEWEIQSLRDFPELAVALSSELLASWAKFCGVNSLPAPARLAPEVVSELNASLQQIEAMRATLTRYRRQNLALAPARVRLKTLRSLVARDPTNAAWRQDVLAFEEAALQEMVAEFDIYMKTESFRDDAWAICTELAAGDWTHPDAAAVAHKMGKRLWADAAESAAARAQKVSELLYADYMAEDVAAASARVAEWRVLEWFMSDAPVKVSAAATENVKLVVDWLEAREREVAHRQSERARVDNLSRLLEKSDSSMEALVQGLRAVDGNRDGCPHDLQELAQARIGEIRMAKRRRRVAIGGASLLVLALMAAAGFVAVQSVLRTAKSTEIAAAVTMNIATGYLDRAQSLLDEGVVLDPGSEVLAVAESALVRAVTAETERAASFRSLMESAGTPDSEGARADRLRSAADIASTEEELAETADWEAKYTAAQATRQAERDSKFADALTIIGEAVVGLNQLDPLGSDAMMRVDEVDLQLSELERRPGISSGARAAAASLTQRLKQIRGDVELARESASKDLVLSDDLRACAQATVDPTRFAERLRAFAQKHEDSLLSADFLVAAGMQSCWETVARWSALAEQLRLESRPDSSRDVSQRLGRLDEFLKTAALSPLVLGVQAYRTSLVEGSSWVQALTLTLNQWPPMSFHQVRLVDGRSFYFDPHRLVSDSLIDGERIRIYEVFTSPNDLKTRFERIAAKAVVFEGQSPQAELCSTLLPLVKGLSADPSITNALRALQLIQNAKRVDPAIRTYLLIGLCEAIAADAPLLSPALTQAVERWQTAEAEGIDWVAESEFAKRPGTKELEAALLSALDTSAIARGRDRGNADAARVLQLALKPVGMMLDGPGGPAAVPARGSLLSGELLWSIDLDASGQCVFHQVGKVGSSGAIELSSGASGLPPGTPIWMGQVP